MKKSSRIIIGFFIVLVPFVISFRNIEKKAAYDFIYSDFNYLSFKDGYGKSVDFDNDIVLPWVATIIPLAIESDEYPPRGEVHPSILCKVYKENKQYTLHVKVDVEREKVYIILYHRNGRDLLKLMYDLPQSDDIYRKWARSINDILNS